MLRNLAIRPLYSTQRLSNSSVKTVCMHQTSKRLFSTGDKNSVVIVSATRTPVGSISGSLSSMKAPQLGSVAVTGALEKAGITGNDVGEVFFGNVVSAGIGQAPAKQVALNSGIPDSVPCTTINKVCASGMKSIMIGAQSIMLGLQDCVVAGGMESMTNIPYYVPKGRSGYRYGHGQFLDGLLYDGLWDPYGNHHMGVCGEICAENFEITRDDQDNFATSSYKKVAAAHEAGLFKSEIVPVEIPQRKGDPKVVDTDEEFTRINFEKLRTLPSAFKKDGTVTAANSSTLNDGASAVVLMSAGMAESKGLKPLAKILGFGDAATKPVDFTIAPALAVPKALKNAGIDDINAVDWWEINEAFSVVVLANIKLLGLNPDLVNPNGGAVALGHPIGSSGSRIVVSLVHQLQREGKIGCAAICNGGGGASALVIEKC